MKPKRGLNKGCVYTGLVGAKMRMPVHRRPTKRIGRTAVRCTDGPLAGEWLRLDTNGGTNTLPFTIAGQSGHYVNGTWKPAP